MYLTCNRDMEGVPGAPFVLTDWHVRVFWSSGLIGRPYEQLYVHTIPLSGCMYRCSHYTPFSSQTWLA